MIRLAFLACLDFDGPTRSVLRNHQRGKRHSSFYTSLEPIPGCLYIPCQHPKMFEERTTKSRIDSWYARIDRDSGLKSGVARSRVTSQSRSHREIASTHSSEHNLHFIPGPQALKMIRPDPSDVSLLILGAGWTSTFLIPLLDTHSIPHAETSTTGRDHTIPFKFDPSSSDTSPYKRLPSATTVLITFPLTGEGQSKHLVSLYRSVHGDANNFIQLGSTGIFTAPHWNDKGASYNTENMRAVAEDELLASPIHGCVLNLAGLYGGPRDPRNWVGRVIKSKEDVRGKKALHLVHGADVARAILAVHENWDKARGKRWIITDLRCYDWWDLIMSWDADAMAEGSGVVEEERARKMELTRWVGECMDEEGVRALPRGPETLGRVLDARDFWFEMGVWPSVGRVR